mgnify:CR=1 FL=1
MKGHSRIDGACGCIRTWLMTATRVVLLLFVLAGPAVPQKQRSLDPTLKGTPCRDLVIAGVPVVRQQDFAAQGPGLFGSAYCLTVTLTVPRSFCSASLIP